MRNLAVGLVCSFVLVCSSLATAQVAVPTYQYDNYRSGTNTHEISLTLSNVNVQTFGRRTVFAVQGNVYAQPLYVPGVVIGSTSHNILYVATEHDQVYAFDVDSGQQLWHTNLLISTGALLVVSPISRDDVGCTDMYEIGITSTPVIDTATQKIFVVALTKEYNVRTQTTTFYQTLYALDTRSGALRSPPHRIAAKAGSLTFDPLIEEQRAALLLLNGQVFVSWASYCDNGAYHGWVMSFDELALYPSGVYVDTPNGRDGGFWGGGSGPAADSSGAIYAGSGNGTFDADSNGSDFGDSILRLTWSSANHTITVADYFTPWDQQTLDAYDRDLGSGGLVLLPDQPGTRYPHLLVQAGKEGTIDLVNRDSMGHFHAGNDSQIVQTLPYAIGGLFGAPAFWNNYAYFNGIYDHLKAFAFDPQAQLLSIAPTSQSPEQFVYPGSTPAVSSNGSSNGIVWIIEADAVAQGGNAVLRAYDANNLASEIYNSEQNPGRDHAGLAVKFTVPTVADGHVFVGAANQVAMYGLLP
jgi:outer membrane protein assembly factor BamB